MDLELNRKGGFEVETHRGKRIWLAAWIGGSEMIHKNLGDARKVAVEI